MMNETKNAKALVEKLLTKVQARAEEKYGGVASYGYMSGYLKGFVEMLAISHPEVLKEVERRLNDHYR